MKTLSELEYEIRKNTPMLLPVHRSEYGSITEEQEDKINRTLKVYAELVKDCTSADRVMELRGELSDSLNPLFSKIREQAKKKGSYNIDNWTIIMAMESFNSFYMPIYNRLNRTEQYYDSSYSE